jgi:hypothetical protein
MTLLAARCPNCGYAYADLWRAYDGPHNTRVEHLICRACAFDWAREQAVISTTSGFMTLSLFFSRDHES